MNRRGVLESGGERPAAGRQAPARSAIGRWRDSLVDFTSANRLLDLGRGGAGMIEVVRPPADDVLGRLRAGGTFAFRSLRAWPGGPGAGGQQQPGAADGNGSGPTGNGPTGNGPTGNGNGPGQAATVPAAAPYILDTPTDPEGLDTALRALMRHSDQQYADRGLPALYLGLGTLTWSGRDRARCSPVLLVPVRLVTTGPRQPPMLEPTEHDPVVNPALALSLSRLGITLPGADGDPARATVRELLGALRAAVAGREGWHAGEGVVLSCFSFAREALYRDLLDHEDLAASHPAVVALTTSVPGGPGSGRSAAVLTGDGRAAAATPVMPLVLDADSSQRACVAAALSGRSFVMNGPPGTGKSQTIANMIGALLHAGRTVLLVSEKAAALDVVRDRLTGAGLGGYLLELHSDSAARGHVARSLATALDTVPPPPVTAAPVTAAPDGLDTYAAALHRVRQPLGSSLHDVLAMIASLETVPAAPALGLAPADLTVEMLEEVRLAAGALAAAWRPAAGGLAFPWRGVTERGPLDDRLYQAASALEALAGAVRVNQTLAEATALTRPSDAPALAGLLAHLLTWPEYLPDEWLTVDTLDAVDAAVAQLSAAITAITARQDQASQAAGAAWQTIPRAQALPTADARALGALVPACADVSGLTPGQITTLARQFSSHADMLERRLGTLSSLAGMLGLRAPETFGQAGDLLVLALLAAAPDRPERVWLSVTGHRAASTAAQALYEAHRGLAAAEAAASAYFTPETLQHDVAGLAQRFSGGSHRLGRLSSDYRTDKRTIAAFTRDGVAPDAAQDHLGLAAAWQGAVQALTAAEALHAPVLGRYYTGRTTDFERLGRALAHAATAVRCARRQDLSLAADHISCDAAPKPVLTATLTEIRRDLSAWQAGLAPPPATAARPELMNGTISGAIEWLRAHLGPLHTAVEFTQAVGETTGRQLTFGQARRLVALRESADSAQTQLSSRDAVFRELCGPLYAGEATDLAALQGGLEWARHLRLMITGGPGPLTPAHLNAAESAVPTDRLVRANDAWRAARESLLAAFSADRRRELAADLDDYTRGVELLEAMFNDTAGPGEWHVHQAARASLAAHGLDGAVEFCISRAAAPAEVPRLIEQSLLREWADYQLRTDPALAVLRAAGRDGLVGAYQELDAALRSAAAAQIVHACETRRPPGDTAGTAAIRHEAGRQSGHAPVPELLARAGPAVQAVKPCFMMPPQAVSQCLPDGLRFDVVIADEASRISAAEAAACAYRGTTLILAGDRQQLPPAAPAGGLGLAAGHGPAELARLPGAGPVLDLARGSGGFDELTLRWHYRSRHEALIAYPNAAFYDGALIPLTRGGEAGEAGAGVELLTGEGTCHAGASPCNPAEAARVAQRVIRHCDTRPGRSLGVVTFGEAQARAVEAALRDARERRPDLDGFFTGDRLRGFFVKDAASAQGDERDVIIVSVGYGPDASGRIALDYGPLAGEDGWRLLNVALTRARERVEIVASLHPGDIPESVPGDGLRHLRRCLYHAASVR